MDDINVFDENIPLTTPKKYSKWGIEFKTTETDEIKTGLEITDDLSTTFNNCLLVIDKCGVKKRIKFKFKDDYANFTTVQPSPFKDDHKQIKYDRTGYYDGYGQKTPGLSEWEEWEREARYER